MVILKRLLIHLFSPYQRQFRRCLQIINYLSRDYDRILGMLSTICLHDQLRNFSDYPHRVSQS